MHHQQSGIDALHGQMTSQLNIDPEVLSGVSCVVCVSHWLFLCALFCCCSLYHAKKLCVLTMVVMIRQ